MRSIAKEQREASVCIQNHTAIIANLHLAIPPKILLAKNSA